MRIPVQKELRRKASAMGLHLPFFYCFLGIGMITALTIGMKMTAMKLAIGGGIIIGTYVVLFILQNMRPPSPSLPYQIINN